jgi:hypothetical protein
MMKETKRTETPPEETVDLPSGMHTIPPPYFESRILLKLLKTSAVIFIVLHTCSKTLSLTLFETTLSNPPDSF